VENNRKKSFVRILLDREEVFDARTVLRLFRKHEIRVEQIRVDKSEKVSPSKMAKMKSMLPAREVTCVVWASPPLVRSLLLYSDEFGFEVDQYGKSKFNILVRTV
jgi:hypothetical protein